jgi:hypothetical protein
LTPLRPIPIPLILSTVSPELDSIVYKNSLRNTTMQCKPFWVLKIDPKYCTVGWVDIGTAARVPLNVIVYLKKVGKIFKQICLTK